MPEPSISRSPDGIRTRATALRGRRARPLHNGAVLSYVLRITRGGVNQQEGVGTDNSPRRFARRWCVYVINTIRWGTRTRT